MSDPGFNDLLKWGIENSAASRNDPSAPAPATKPDFNALGQLVGMGMQVKSDVDVMKDKMTVVENDQISLEDRRDAFEAFEELVTRIDNAISLEHVNNIELWTRLVNQLDNQEPDLRGLAALSIASAVENNSRGQERLLMLGTIPTLVKLGTEDEDSRVRRRAILALSSVSRNFQPALNAVIENVPERFKPKDKLDASDMSSVDTLIGALRAEFASQN